MTTPTWSYSGDPATSDRDQVRFLIQDTDLEVPLLSDNEVNFLVTKWFPLYQSLTYVAAIAASVVARRFASVLNVSGDGVSVSTADLAQRYTDMATRLREEYKLETAVGGSADIENLMIGTHLDESIVGLAFSMAIHDNPAAGAQDLGGRRAPYWENGVVNG